MSTRSKGGFVYQSGSENSSMVFSFIAFRFLFCAVPLSIQ
ncbi:hypothetical protein HMPREF0653_01957 [Prevotella disiens JCM 6334 = ATCC 29426]|uniref:Uncharacterized protein n=1 Tax=Prevotella disiens JCM 6334 = ATCC 29426 TaxID=1235811 RepID=A0ABP2Y5L3_9BACT|nr:hypothetical protein HMPREF0653_01957 [Prevotella disiens JCM 6334 = ATCC 29426]